MEIEQKKIAESHQVTRSPTPRTAAVAPHWCSSEATRDWISHASTTTSINQLLFFFLLFFLVLFFRGQKNAMSLFLVELVFFKFLSQMGFTAQAFVVIFFLQNRQPSILLVFTSTSYFSWHLCVPDKAAKD